MLDESNNSLSTRLLEGFEHAYMAERVRVRHPNIYVCGGAGGGKTSLIQAVFGDVLPEDNTRVTRKHKKSKHHKNNDDPFENIVTYDLNDVVVLEAQGYEFEDPVEEYISREKRIIDAWTKDGNPDNHIHIIWYVLPGCGVHFQTSDVDFLKEFANLKSFVVVITKSEITSNTQKESVRTFVENCGIPENRIIFTVSRETLEGMESRACEGCDKLINLSLELLPEAYKDSFIGAQILDVERKVEMIKSRATKAKAIIAASVARAAGIAATPIPVADVPLLMSIQTSMIASLAAIYGINSKELSVLTIPLVIKAARLLVPTGLGQNEFNMGITSVAASHLTSAMGMFVYSQLEKAAIQKAKNMPAEGFSLAVETFMLFLKNQSSLMKGRP